MNRKQEKHTSRGITIIALVITIIVMLILTSVTIKLISEGGLITKAQEAKIKQEVAQLKEEFDMFCITKQIDAKNSFMKDSITASETILVYNEKQAEGKNIYDVIPSLANSNYKGRTEIIKGKIYITTTNKKEIKWLQEMGIEPSPWKIENGVLLSSETNLYLLGDDGTLVIPATVNKIAKGAFANVEGIKKIIIPGNVKIIEANAFAYNPTLEEVVIEDGVEEIGLWAFRNCFNLEKVKMSNTIITIGTEAFSNNYKLKKINLSEKLQEISTGLLINSTLLETITIPESVTKISNNSFSGSTIKNINIPQNVKSIGNNAFSYDSLEEIQLSSQNKYFSYKDGVLMTKDGTQIKGILKTAIKGDTFTIPNGVKNLGIGLLSNAYEITKVKIPSSVENIHPGAFYNSTKIENIEIDESNLKYTSTDEAIYNKDKTELIYFYANKSEVTIKEGVTKIGDCAFYNRNNITALTLPQSLTTIGTKAFVGGAKLTNLHLGEKVQNLDTNFMYASKINNITVDVNNPYFTAENRMLFSKDKTKLIAIAYPIGTITSFTIPEGVKEIGDYVFFGQRKLQNIKIPDTVTKIGSAFGACSNLKSIIIPSSVKEISGECFSGCSNLKEIIVQKPKDSIKGAPWGCPITYKEIKWNG